MPKKKRARINFKNLFAISFMIILYLVAFFWGGYYALTPIVYLFVFFGIMIVSTWIGIRYYTTKDLLCLVIASTLVALVDEIAHTSVGTISYSNPSPFAFLEAILRWSILIIVMAEVAKRLEIRLVAKKKYIHPRAYFRRILPVLACFIVLSAVMVAQGIVYTFDWLILLVYVTLFVASFIYTSVHTLRSNLTLIVISLIFGLSIEYIGSWQGLWTFGFNEPISLLILFSWPIRTWTAYLICLFVGSDFLTLLYDPKVLKDKQSLEQICSDKSIIVVADTHFGLSTEDEEDDPDAFADFLKWIKDLEIKKKYTLNVGDWIPEYSRNGLELKPPAKIIFLGDILDLWDTSNESVFASTMYIIQLLSELNCQKIYLLGNHDNDLATIKEKKYPLGTSEIEIFEKDEYHIDGEKGKYVFLHGHQFEKSFALPAWKEISSIRKAGLVFGKYTRFFVILFLFDIIRASGFLDSIGFNGGVNMITILLAALSIPFIFINSARNVFNNIKTIKFNPEAGRDTAKDMNIVDQMWDPDSRKYLSVIYGHTHTIDDWIYSEIDVNSEEEDIITLRIMNIPSWVINKPTEIKSPFKAIKEVIKTELTLQRTLKSRKESLKEEISHVFLYIDKDIPVSAYFIGWDVKKGKPYFIPNDVIYNKREFGSLSNPKGYLSEPPARWPPKIRINEKNVEQKLAAINWPEKLRERWMKDSDC